MLMSLTIKVTFEKSPIRKRGSWDRNVFPCRALKSFGYFLNVQIYPHSKLNNDEKYSANITVEYFSFLYIGLTKFLIISSHQPHIQSMWELCNFFNLCLSMK